MTKLESAKQMLNIKRCSGIQCAECFLSDNGCHRDSEKILSAREIEILEDYVNSHPEEWMPKFGEKVLVSNREDIISIEAYFLANVGGASPFIVSFEKPEGVYSPSAYKYMKKYTERELTHAELEELVGFKFKIKE